MNDQNLVIDGSGKPIFDATEDLLIRIEPQHGDKAIQCDQGHCVFAEAAKEQLPGLLEVKFSRRQTRLCFPTHIVRYTNSSSITTQILRYDDTEDFETGEYYLLAPSPSRKLGARAGAPHGKKTGTRKVRTHTLNVHKSRPTSWSFKDAQPRKKVS